jgi:hypothetical protein
MAETLLGRVVVVAGDDARLSDVASATLAADARVAVVSRALPAATAATVRFHADPRDPGAWERIAMHVEQHLGPIDGVVSDEASRSAVEKVFTADLRRRGRGAVVVVHRDADVDAIVTRLLGTPPTAPSRPRADEPGP